MPNTNSDFPVWFMGHPIAPDEKHGFVNENLTHVNKLVRIFYNAGFRVVTPYHNLVATLDDANPEMRRVGLEVDCVMVQMLGRLILTGHKISNGMQIELDALVELYPEAHTEGRVLNFIGIPDAHIPSVLEYRLRHG